jgi:hypothetical protein
MIVPGSETSNGSWKTLNKNVANKTINPSVNTEETKLVLEELESETTSAVSTVGG